MNELPEIIEISSLDKFKKLVKMIIGMRGQMQSIHKNNRNGYFRAADHNGNLQICRTLLDQSPERPKEIEQALIDVIYELTSSQDIFRFKKRTVLTHESSKSENETTVFVLRFGKRFFACGGLQAHENVALTVLYLYSAIKEYYSPAPASQEYIDAYQEVYAALLLRSMQNSQEGNFCKKAVALIDVIVQTKRDAWVLKSKPSS